MSKRDFARSMILTGLCVMAFLLAVWAQEPDNINPQDGSLWTIDFPVPVDRSKRAWDEVPYCPNSEEDGIAVADTSKWTDGCTLRWNKAEQCFECL